MNSSIDRIDVAKLADLDLRGLRVIWAEAIGAPPSLRSAEMLRRLLAWQVQAARHGGIDRELRKHLQQKRAHGATRLHAGTRLVKEWQGRRYEVLIDQQGPLFEGRRYRSLSEIAREITGTRWNGPRFFGLRDQPEVG